MKIDKLFPDKNLIITQGEHGANQGNKAMDFYGAGSDWHRFIAPFDGTIRNYHNLGFQSFFNFVSDGNKDVMIQFVHCYPHKLNGGKFKKGEELGVLVRQGGAPHMHAAIKIGNTWRNILDYYNRSAKLLPEPNGKIGRWNNWNTYANRQLPNGVLPITPKPDPKDEKTKELENMVKEQKKLIAQAENKVAELNQTVQDTRQHVSGLREELESNNRHVLELEEENNKKDEKIKELKKKVENQRKELENLNKNSDLTILFQKIIQWIKAKFWK